MSGDRVRDIDMRILTVHNYYRIRGGEDESRDMEDRLLRERGHEVVEFLADSRSIEGAGLQVGIRAIWNTDAYRELRALIRSTRPDLVSVQNFFPLISPAAYLAAQAEAVPVVQIVRNYRLICPNALLFRDGEPCEDCLRWPVPIPGIVHRCYRQSAWASSAVAAMLGVHRVMGTWSRAIDVYVVLTDFARRKLEEGGLPPHKMVVRPNFVYPDPGVRDGEGEYFVFVGRLAPEKGLRTLMSAWEGVRGAQLKVVGGGDPKEVEKARSWAKAAMGVELVGQLSHEETLSAIKRAVAVVFPSEWYEGFPRVIVEAFACGVPVIPSRLGGMAEIVDDGRSGLLFNPGDPRDLLAKIEWAISNPAQLSELGREGRQEFEAKYTADRFHENTQAIWAAALSRGGDRKSEYRAG